jgi:NADH-quinone oxidoreductase subunit E
MDKKNDMERVDAVLNRHRKNPHRLVSILQEIQDIYTYLPAPVMEYVARELSVTAGAVYGVATFYSHFTLEAKGKYVIKVCDGTACHVKRSAEIIKTLREELKLTENKKTSDDLLFTLETVACLGACGLAPVVVVNDEVHGAMTKEKTAELLNQIRAKEAAHA